MNLEALYQQIATAEGITPEEVRAEMQNALNLAWARRDKTAAMKKRQAAVPHKGEAPTVEEFLEYAAEVLKQKK